MGSKGAQRGRGEELTEKIKKIDPGWKSEGRGSNKSRGRRMKKRKEDDHFEEASKQR